MPALFRRLRRARRESATPAAGTLAGLASVLVGVLGIGFLARRFNPSPWAWLLITALAGTMPYRWITLFGGSPTGFAMALPPWFAYGLDRAIRDRSPAGGLLAGLALLFSYTADLHVQTGNIIIAESTHEGGRYGLNYELIRAAQATGSNPTAMDWRFHFFPWWREPQYTLPLDGRELAVPANASRLLRQAPSGGCGAAHADPRSTGM